MVIMATVVAVVSVVIMAMGGRDAVLVMSFNTVEMGATVLHAA